MTFSKGFFKNPLFYYGLISVFLFSSLYMSLGISSNTVFSMNKTVLLGNINNLEEDALFSSQNKVIALETPDLKTIQGNTVYSVAPPSVVSTKVLGDIFGNNNAQKEIISYVVQSGDTLDSIANAHKISVNTILWANDLTNSSKIKAGQSLIILPTNGVLHIVKSGDTMLSLASTYKANADDIVSYNDLIDKDDIYIGDRIVVPDGIMPKKADPVTPKASANQVPIANNYFIIPVSGKITQGLHYYNAIDIANACGTPVRASASGVVQKVRYGWNFGGGNYVTILHSNGVVTYYGHFSTIFVKQGDRVSSGDKLGLIGLTGRTTGCHLHFDVIGGKNFLSSYPVGSWIKY